MSVLVRIKLFAGGALLFPTRTEYCLQCKYIQLQIFPKVGRIFLVAHELENLKYDTSM